MKHIDKTCQACEYLSVCGQPYIYDDGKEEPDMTVQDMIKRINEVNDIIHALQTALNETHDKTIVITTLDTSLIMEHLIRARTQYLETKIEDK